MIQFLNESFAAIPFVIMLSVLFGLVQYFVANAYVSSQDKVRSSKGMAPMTDEEKKIVVKAYRSAVIATYFTILGVYVISILVTYIFFL